MKVLVLKFHVAMFMYRDYQALHYRRTEGAGNVAKIHHTRHVLIYMTVYYS